MNLLRVNFPELYERHLCRHSQYGINVAHIATVIGTYLAICGIVYGLVDSPAAVLCLAIPYLAILALNTPLRVLAALVVFLALLFTLFFALPKPPIWLCLIAIVALYKLQAWSHKIYTLEKDMTEFNKKYPKGVTLFFLLSLYELPLLLNYLCFDRKSWATQAGPAQAEVSASRS
jgi:hypothetical protein